MCRRCFKTCSKDVFLSGTISMFISWVVIKKSIFENFEILWFWVIFTVFLGYFSYCKSTTKKRFFRISNFLAESVERSKRCLHEVTLIQANPLVNISWIPEHSQPKISRSEKSNFSPTFTVREIALKYSENDSKWQNRKFFKNRFFDNDSRYEHRSCTRQEYIPWACFEAPTTYLSPKQPKPPCHF